MENRKKIVVLDGYTLCAGELNFDALREFGEVTVYDRVAQADVAARIGDAQIVLTNKALITAEVMDACPRMEYVGVTATGYNVVDVAEAKRRGIVVTNAPAYSTQAVAQHTFALLLESLRVLKKGGVFVLHDNMKPQMYGDMNAFAKKLRDMGFEKAEYVETAAAIFGSKSRAALMMLGDSAMIVGRK